MADGPLITHEENMEEVGRTEKEENAPLGNGIPMPLKIRPGSQLPTPRQLQDG
jgi:hypothetical protein